MVLNADEKNHKGAFKKDDLLSEKKDRIHCREYIEAKDIGRYEIKRIHYLEYGTKRCPGQIRCSTFPELYRGHRVLVNGFGAIQAVLDDDKRYLHNHTIYALVPWRTLRGVENNSISASIKRYCTMAREEMDRLSQSMDERYLLGLLNSRLGLYLLNLVRGGDFHILPEHLRAIPVAGDGTAGTMGISGTGATATVAEETAVPDVSAAAVQARIAALVEQVLAAKSTDRNADTASLEAEIDQLVYQLYGLTDEEIEIVEGRTPADAAITPPAETGRRSAARTPHRGTVAEPPAFGDEVLE